MSEIKQVSVFISYAREDYDRVIPFYYRLSQEGLNVWMDKINILAGEVWDLKIKNAIRNSDFFVLFLSSNSSYKRGYLQKEIKIALDAWQEKLEDDIYFIPIRLDECEIPSSLSKFQYIDFFGGKTENDFLILLDSLNKGASKLGKQIEKSEFKFRIESKSIEEGLEKAIPYDIAIQYPKILNVDGIKCDEINNSVMEKILETYEEFRKGAIGSMNDTKLVSHSGFNSLSIDYQVHCLNDTLLSLEFMEASYGAGAAHSNYYIYTMNIDLPNQEFINYDDLFEDVSKYLSFVSQYCISELKKQMEDEDDYSKQIEEGASEDIENFEHFCLTDKHLIIIFNTYQVGPFAWGPRQVLIPYENLGEIIKKDSIISRLIVS